MTRTPAKRYFVAELRNDEGHSLERTFISTSRSMAFRALILKGWRVTKFFEVDEASEEMERHGFRPATTRPASIDWRNLDLY